MKKLLAICLLVLGNNLFTETDLQKAVRSGDLKQVKELLVVMVNPHKYVNPNKYDSLISPLRLAVRLPESNPDKQEIIRSLVNAGVDVNRLETVEEFLTAEGFPFRCPAINTVLHEAVLKSDPVTVKTLLELGANPKKNDNGGITPLRLVFNSCYTPNINPEIKEMLKPFFSSWI